MQQMAKVGMKEVEHGAAGFHEQLLGEPGSQRVGKTALGCIKVLEIIYLWLGI